MVNERTRELVQLCVSAVFDKFDINVTFDEEDGCVVVETGEQTFELTKFYEDVERRHFNTTRTVEMARFKVVRFQYDPGVWRHSDGSGTPPSWDETDDGTFDSLPMAIKWTIGCIVDQVVDDTMLAAEMARDIEYEVEVFDEHGEYIGE